MDVRTLERDVRQFRRLVRLSYGRILDAALGSRDIAAEHFVIWGGALLATPTLLYMVRSTSAYPFIRRRSLELLQQVALVDRLFFIVWTMLAAMLLASLLWEALFPDRTDRQILGVLPVSSRMVAAARLTAALVVGVAFLGAISLPTAIGYSLVGAAHPVLGPRAGILAGQVLSTIGAGLFTFTTLLTLRGLLVFVVGAAAAARMAVLLQVVTVLLLVEAFLFLPGILPGILRHLTTPGVPADTWLAPAWFLGLSIGMGGPRREVLGVMAPTAVAATLGMLVAAFLVYVLPAPSTARRAIEARLSDRTSRFGEWLTAIAARIVIARPSRAMLAFTLRSLARSPRHHLVLATWLGLALAVGGIRLMAAEVRGRPLPLDAPTDFLIALPLVLTFFLVGGLRAAFALPTDVQANWTFRLAAGFAPGPCLNAVRAALWLLAVAPVTGATVAVGTWLWGLEPALAVGAMHAASGVCLCELAVLDCEAIPFTRGRSLTNVSLKVGAPLGLVGLILFAFTLDDIQLWALDSTGRVGAYVLTAVVVTLAIRVAGRRRPRPPIPSFDGPTEEMTALRLSGATG